MNSGRLLALLRVSVVVLALGSGGALFVVDPEDSGDPSAPAAQAAQLPFAGADGGATTTTVALSSPAPRGPTTAVPEVGAPAVGDPGSDAGTGARPAPPTGGDADGAASSRSGDLPIEVSVAPACGKKGSTLTATVKVPPGTQLSLLVAYADGTNKGEMYAGAAGPDGSFRYPWTIPATAPEGTGQVMVAATDPATDRSGTNRAPFRVVAGSC